MADSDNNMENIVKMHESLIHLPGFEDLATYGQHHLG